MKGSKENKGCKDIRYQGLEVKIPSMLHSKRFSYLNSNKCSELKMIQNKDEAFKVCHY